LTKKITYIEDRSAAIVRGVKTSAYISFKDAPPQKNPKLKDLIGVDSVIALWGDANDFPQQVIEDVRKDPELGALLKKDADLMTAGGLCWGIPEYLEDGTEYLKPLTGAENDVIKDFIEKSRINTRYLPEGGYDLVWFAMGFVEFVLTRDKSKIIQLAIQAAENCRLSKQDDSGKISTCYINANWPNAQPKDKLTITMPVLDPYYDPAGMLRELASKNKDLNYIYPISIASPGCTYYQRAAWDGIRQSGWLEVSQAIPKHKKALLEKQLNIKYHVEISDQYWSSKYQNWNSMTIDQREQKVDETMKTFSDILSGVENAGNSLVTAMKTNLEMGKEISLWKISPIDSSIKNGQFLEEGKDASLYKAAAVGLHPALIGTVPNNGLGGAGSNIRESYNLNNIRNRSAQDILLEPLTVVRDYNGWNKNVVFRIKNPFMTTLDKGKEQSQTDK
jgi:hypothetical protein